MRLERLHIEHLRCIGELLWVPDPGLNVLVGDNGAGKTSVLEAVMLLSRGRSFRQGGQDALLQRGADELRVFGQLAGESGERRLGLARGAGKWSGRVDGRTVARLSDLFALCAVVCFEPGSHELIGGGASGRRQFVDWGVFHVEHAFLGAWQEYRRALKQRNVLLRAASAPSDRLLAPWESSMARCARVIHASRAGYVQTFTSELRDICAHLLPELGELSLEYRPGWDVTHDLAALLRADRERDRARGHTTQGIHRADWRPGFSAAPRREYFSRGQEKLCALACVLAQARAFVRASGEWPIVCLDDLSSELDAPHQRAVTDWLATTGAQVLITGTEPPAALVPDDVATFHVEHGSVHGI